MIRILLRGRLRPDHALLALLFRIVVDVELKRFLFRGSIIVFAIEDNVGLETQPSDRPPLGSLSRTGIC